MTSPTLRRTEPGAGELRPTPPRRPLSRLAVGGGLARLPRRGVHRLDGRRTRRCRRRRPRWRRAHRSRDRRGPVVGRRRRVRAPGRMDRRERRRVCRRTGGRRRVGRLRNRPGRAGPWALVTGAGLGAAQGLVLARRDATPAVPWGPRCRCCSRSAGPRQRAGISVDDQFTVFGADGAIVFTLLSGLLLARFTPVRAQAA